MSNDDGELVRVNRRKWLPVTGPAQTELLAIVRNDLRPTPIQRTPPKAIQDPTGTEIARITKSWAGWVKERFTNADNYVVQIHQSLDDPVRSLVIAAALAIDIALKQADPHGSIVIR